MKEKIDVFIVNFKKVWADARGKSLIKLGLYMFFLIFATLTATATLQLNETKKEINKPVDVVKDYSEYKNFTGNYLIGGVKYPFTIASKQVIRINDILYFAEGKDLVNAVDPSKEVPTFDFKFWYLTPKFIYDLMQNGEKAYTTTYANGSVETSYIVPLKYFASNYTGTILPVESILPFENMNISISTIETNKKIVKVKLDLSTYYVLINDQVVTYNVEIDYN
jgi:hypothetical protein